MPRTWLTQVHTSQPSTEESTIDQKRPSQTIGVRWPTPTRRKLGAEATSMSGAPKASV